MQVMVEINKHVCQSGYNACEQEAINMVYQTNKGQEIKFGCL